MPIPDNPQTRQEMYLSAIANGDSGGIPETPYTRKEMYLEAIATGDPSGIPETPYTREEMYLDEIARNGGGGGGGDITVVSKSIGANGTYTAPSGKAYSPVTVDVPNSYAAGDEGKVVSNGELVAQTAHAKVTQNGTIDTTLNDSVEVEVSGGGGMIFAPMDYSVTFQNVRSTGTITYEPLTYSDTTTLKLVSQSNIIVGGSASQANMATDGTHIWIRATNTSTIKYNGENADFIKDGQCIRITIPAGFDGTIPFMLS